MNEEIKEILDNLKYTAKKHTIQVLENGGKIEHCPQEIETELRLNTYSANLLLNYITNLQEEKIKLKETNEEHRKINGDLRKENQKLVKVIDELEKYLEKRMNGDCYYRGQLEKIYEEIFDKLTELKGGKNEDI